MPRRKAGSGDGEANGSFAAELLRILFLQQLIKGPNYPTGLAKELKANGVQVTAAYASVLMADLKEAGLVSGSLVFSDVGRPRRMYTLTAQGKAEAPKMVATAIKELRAILARLQG